MYIVFSKHDLVVFILKKKPAFILVYGLKFKNKINKNKKNNEKTNELEERHYARMAVGIQR